MSDPENPQGPANSDVSVVNADGSFVENWVDKYPEADRPTLSRFNKFDDFVTSHMTLRRQFNKDPDSLVEIPGDDATDEVRAEFHRKRGVPDAVEGYKYEKSKELSENVDIDKEKILAFAQIAKKHNFTNKQFNGAINDWLALLDKDITNFDIATDEKDEQNRQKGVEALKKHFGNGLEERTLRSEAVMRKYGNAIIKGEDGKESTVLDKLYDELPEIKNSPWIRLMFDAIAEDMSEDRIKGLTTVTTPTPSQVDAKIAELRAHEAYMDGSHPQHKQINDQITELYKKKSA